MLRSFPRIIDRTIRGLQRDDGVAALAVAGAISIVAFTALSLFLSSFAGTRALERAQAAAQGGSSALPAVLAYFYQQATPTLPCPDRDLDGVSEATCDGSGGNARSGTLPWATLGLTPNDALDGENKYFSYVVSNTAKNVCFSIANDYDATDVEFTGSIIEPTDLELLLTSESAGEGRYVPFALISHGPNGYGTFTKAGTATTAPPVAHTFEDNNDNDNPTVIYTGPRDEDGTNQFDDYVISPTRAQMQSTCEQLTPGESLNASLSENFESGSAGIDTAKFDTSASDAPTKTTDSNNNGVADFTTNNSYLATDSEFNFTSTNRPVYVAATWTPAPNSPAATSAGFSIATRATVGDLTAGTDQFNGAGISFRFDDRDGSTSSSGGVLNNIRIRENTTDLATSASQFNLINGEAYLLEVYDNGSDVWMRITQKDDIANTATASYTFPALTDLSGEQRVLLINGPVQSFIDDVTVGVPMLALETNGSSGYAATAAAANGTASGDLTLEAWIRPFARPTAAGEVDTIISQWDVADTDNSSFRLYLDGDNNGQLVFEVGGTIGTNPDVESFDLGLRPTLNKWAHVAVTFDGTSKSVHFYLNGVLARAATSTTDAGSGVRTAAKRFAVGAGQNVADTWEDFFHGNISDVRVWSAARTSNEIRSCFQVRLPSSACPATNLVANWKFDPTPSESSLAETDALANPVGTAGVLTNSSYVPALAVYFRPFSTTFCPAGTRVGAYQCDFRDSTAAGLVTSATIPSNLRLVYAKVWGAGGGGWDRSNNNRNESVGGSGGFSQGLIESINAVSIAGQSVNIYYGGFGTGSFTNNPNDRGGGGGAGAGIYNSLNTVAGLVAGGGGANIGDDAAPIDCISLEHTVNQCGMGGHGGGAGGSANTSRAPDAGSNSCGGRGGDNGPYGAEPPSADAANCPDGGTDPVGTFGGAGTTGPLGGGAGFAVMAGGRGIDGDEADGAGNNYAGAGGGGGEAGGYRDQTNFQGFGGGGGSGTADAGVHHVSGEVRVLDFFENSTNGNFATGSPIITNIDDDPAGLGWEVGMYIDSHVAIPAGTTIVSIDSATQITMSENATAGNNNRRFTVTRTSGGGIDDPDYSPSYLNGTEALQRPGTGGVAGANINGRGGAVVLKW